MMSCSPIRMRVNSSRATPSVRSTANCTTRRRAEVADCTTLPSTASSAHSAAPPSSNPIMPALRGSTANLRSEEHTSELQSHLNLVCRLLLEKKKPKRHAPHNWNYHTHTPLPTAS